MKRLLHPSGVLRAPLARVLLVLVLGFCWVLGLVCPVSKTKQALRQVMPVVRLAWNTPSAASSPSASVATKTAPSTVAGARTVSSASPFNASKVALLIEPRPLPHLAAQILHMIAVVPPDWRFLFLGSTESVFALARPQAIRNQRAIGKLELREVPSGGLSWRSIESKEHVFRLLTDLRFYDEYMPGVEWILKYEHDSLLCANAEVSLDEWLVWDWAGALRSGNDRFAGFGGLSLRRVSAIKRVLGFQARAPNSEPEDIWFGKRIPLLPGARVATRLDGVLSAEDDIRIDRPMGYHVPGGEASSSGGGNDDFGRNGLDEAVWGDADRRRAVLEYCPELRIIMDMKLERERCPDDDGQGHRAAGLDIFDIDWEQVDEEEGDENENENDDEVMGSNGNSAAMVMETMRKKLFKTGKGNKKVGVGVGNPDVAVRVGVVDREGADVADGDGVGVGVGLGVDGTAVVVKPPQPPPLPRPWRGT